MTMNKMTLVRPMFFALSLLLVACGGKPLAPTKEAAAGALFQSSRGASSTPGGLLGLFEQRVTPSVDVDIKVSCPQGGNVTLRYRVDTTGGATGLTYDLIYDNCNYNGRTSMRGTMSMTMVVNTGQTYVTVGLNLKGRVEFSGEISDFVETDITETVGQTELGSPTGTVSITLNGWIKTSSGTYNFTNEVIAINGTDLIPAPEEG